MEGKSLNWSSCKHPNTIKYFIGIALQSPISFISQGQCRGSNDPDITKNSNFYKKKKEKKSGGKVMADRGHWK